MANQHTENQTIINNITDELRLNPIHDIIPRKVMPSISPVFEVNPKLANVAGSANSATSAGAATALTTSSSLDTYITGVCLSISKDATCDAASGTLGANVTINGATISLVTLQHQTLTAIQDAIALSLPFPLKVDRNSTIRTTNLTFTAGACRVGITFNGFTREANNQFVTG